MIRSDNWKRYYDEEYSSYYLYNEISGESVWETDFARAAAADATDENSGLHNRAVEVDSETEDRKARTFRSKDYSRDVPLTPEEKIQYDLRCYSRFLFINAAVVEAPLLILEISLRLLLLILVAFALVLYYSYSRNWPMCIKVLKKYGREVSLNVAAVTTLAIPGLICLIYWGHNHEYDWDLRPLPTILGYVDVRRFAVISFGGGALARNIAGNPVENSVHSTECVETETDEATESLTKSTTKGKARATKPSKKPKRKNKSKVGIRYCGKINDDDNQDSWKGRLMWVPREVLSDCSVFMKGGSDRLDSLDIAL